MQKTSTTKSDIKIFLSDLIRDPIKRKKVIELYNTSTKYIQNNIQNVIKNNTIQKQIKEN